MMSQEMQLLADESVNMMLGNESRLVRRYAQAAPFSARITCEFTSDAAMLHQYYRLRESQFGTIAGIQSGSKDAFDDQSQVIVARNGLLCVGGARMTIATPELSLVMPMEEHEIRLSRLFPELDLDEVSYAEISRLALLSEKGGFVLTEMLRGLVKLSVAEDVEYLFSLTSFPEARRMQQAMQSLDVNCEMRHDIVIPEYDIYDGAKMVLSVMDISKYAHSLRAKKREKLMLDEPIA